MPRGSNFKGSRPKNTPKGPSTQAKVDLRITEVGKLLVEGYPRFEIVSIMNEKYSISSQQADRYIKTAKERIREKNNENLEDDIALTDMMILDVYRSAREGNQWNSVLAAIKLRMDLKGLSAPKRSPIKEGGTTLRMEDLEKFGENDGLSDEQKLIAQRMTLLSE